jgi:hypothetical protein
VYPLNVVPSEDRLTVWCQRKKKRSTQNTTFQIFDWVKCHLSTDILVFHYSAIIYKSLHGDVVFLKRYFVECQNRSKNRKTWLRGSTPNNNKNGVHIVNLSEASIVSLLNLS